MTSPNMISMPPPRVQIGGGAPGAAPGGPSAQGGSPDPAEVKKRLMNAITELQAAADAEGDPQSDAEIFAIVAKVKQIIGGHQQTEDQLMGGGPAVKMLRRSGGAA